MINSPHPNLNAPEGALPGVEGTLRRASRGFFITGTDTGVGKTRISLAVLRTLQRQGWHVDGMKPVASGCDITAEGLLNEDALLLQQHSSTLHPYDTINPYAFVPAIAPHLAASRAGVHIELAPIVERFNGLAAHSDAVIVEGAGGWLVPLNDEQTMADLAQALQLPVVLVVAIRLGCINHALLTADAIRARACTLAGWIANHVSPATTESADIVSSISARIAAPLFGEVSYQLELDVDRMASSIDSRALRKAAGDNA